MDTNKEQSAAQDLIALIKTMTPTFEILPDGVKFTDNGVTATIPTAISRQVISTKRLK